MHLNAECINNRYAHTLADSGDDDDDTNRKCLDTQPACFPRTSHPLATLGQLATKRSAGPHLRCRACSSENITSSANYPPGIACCGRRRSIVRVVRSQRRRRRCWWRRRCSTRRGVVRFMGKLLTPLALAAVAVAVAGALTVRSERTQTRTSDGVATVLHRTQFQCKQSRHVR